jgi:hypothetical protein
MKGTLFEYTVYTRGWNIRKLKGTLFDYTLYTRGWNIRNVFVRGFQADVC